MANYNRENFQSEDAEANWRIRRSFWIPQNVEMMGSFDGSFALIYLNNNAAFGAEVRTLAKLR